MKATTRQSGFALIITLALLALLVLAVLALSSLVRVGGHVSAAGTYQVQARQNALAAFNTALSELQKYAGPNSRATAKADIDSGTLATNRNWTGVWDNQLAGTAARWLVSGAVSPQSYAPEYDALPPFSSGKPYRLVARNINHVVLVGENTINTGTASLTYVVGDGIIVPRVRVMAEGVASPFETGGIAYWVGDEGVKMSMIALDDLTAPGAIPPTSLTRTDITLLFSTFLPDDTNVLKLLTTEQIPSVKSGLQLAQNYHNFTLNALGIADGLPRGLRPTRYRRVHLTSGATSLLVSGPVNLNSTIVISWRALYRLACINAGVTVPAATRQTNFANALIAGLRASEVNKGAGVPFLSLTDFRDSAALGTALTAGATPVALTRQLFMDNLEPLLLLRSDTFRIRAYGDAVNPASDAASPKVEAKAYCEAIVQRIPELLDATKPELGQRFKVVYFRWLGPDDI